MLAALAADTARHMRRVRAVLQVVSAGCRQGGLQSLGPLLVGPGEPKHPIRGSPRSRVSAWNGCPRIDRVQELLPHLDWLADPALGLFSRLAEGRCVPAGNG